MPRNPYRSWLDPRFLPSEGLIKHRPGNSVVIVKSNEPVYQGVSRWNRVGRQDKLKPREYRDEVVDSTRSWVQDFAFREITDLQHQASKVVMAINHHYSSALRTRAKRAFLAGLEANNICWNCELPIKVTKSSIKRKHIEGCPVLKDRKLRCKCPSVVNEPEKVMRKSPYSFRPHWIRQNRTNRCEAVIPSHFEWFQDSEESEAYYRFVDGTDRDIRYRREATTKLVKAITRRQRRKANADGMVTKTFYKEYLVEILADGTEVPCVPEPQYLRYNVKCECKIRRSKKVKVHRV